MSPVHLLVMDILRSRGTVRMRQLIYLITEEGYTPSAVRKAVVDFSQPMCINGNTLPTQIKVSVSNGRAYVERVQ